MNVLIAIATTYKDVLTNNEPTIYKNAYDVFLSLLQGVFTTLNNAGIYLAASVLSLSAGLFMWHGRNAKVIVELKEDLRGKLIVIAFMASFVSLVAFIITSSYGARI